MKNIFSIKINRYFLLFLALFPLLYFGYMDLNPGYIRMKIIIISNCIFHNDIIKTGYFSCQEEGLEAIKDLIFLVWLTLSIPLSIYLTPLFWKSIKEKNKEKIKISIKKSSIYRILFFLLILIFGIALLKFIGSLITVTDMLFLDFHYGKYLPI